MPICRQPEAELLWHDDGHVMPSNEHMAEVAAFMEKSLAKA